MQERLIKSLFKPIEHKRKSFIDFLDEDRKRNFFKHRFWFECSKAVDESCINTDCQHNYLDMHNDELYVELMQEIQAERQAVEDRMNKHRKEYGFAGD